MKQVFTTITQTFATFLIILCTFSTVNAQEIITRWNFNGPAADQVPGGAEAPATVIGNGIAMLAGGTTATFASGVASGGSSDPETTSPPNYGWNSTTYPAQGTAPKTAGVQFNVSTAGYENINFMFDQRLSNTAANTWMVQYCTDVFAGEPVWVDAQLFTVVPQPTGTGDTWFNQRAVDFVSVSGLNNNANAGFRIVSDFDPNSGNYLAARSTSTYGPAGTSRFDMVTVSGTLITATPAIDLNQPKVFVNNNQIVIQSIQNNPADVVISDVSGRIVIQTMTQTGNINIPASDLKGIYFVTIIGNNNKQFTRKIFINQ